MKTDKNEKKRNKTWYANDYIIKNAYYKFVIETKESPTLRQLAEKTNLNHNTIAKHLSNMDFEIDISPKLKLLSERVLLSVGMKAITKGSAAEGKLFLQAVEKIKFDRSETEVSGNLTIADLIRNANAKDK